MTTLPLRLGPLEARGLQVARSGLRWLCPDGHVCRAGESVAYCSIAFSGDGALFADEGHEVQVALASPLAGRVYRVPGVSCGGYMDRLPTFPWAEDTVWANLEATDDLFGTDRAEAELLFLTGRRFADVAENRAGILTGWHSRTRSWWGANAHQTLLASGNCEMDAIFRGDDGFFRDIFESVSGPAQIVLSQNDAMVPRALVLAEQLDRTTAEAVAIREDIARSFGAGRHAPAPQDWIFMGALLDAVETSPLRDVYDVLTRAGLTRTGPAAVVCLSLAAELPVVARHRRLGYAINIQNFRVRKLGSAVRSWLQTNFERVPRSVDDIAADLRRLITSASDRLFLIVNQVSSQLYEQIHSYGDLDAETVASLSTLRAKELNLMLHDLMRSEPNVVIIDADAAAADLGMRWHFRDGTHGSGAFYGEIRGELLRVLRDYGVAGFGARALSRS